MSTTQRMAITLKLILILMNFILLQSLFHGLLECIFNLTKLLLVKMHLLMNLEFMQTVL